MPTQDNCLLEAIAEALLEARRSARGDVMKVTNAFINRRAESRCPRRRGAYQTFIRLLTAPSITALPNNVLIGDEAVVYGDGDRWRLVCYGNNGERDASAVLVRVGTKAFEALRDLAWLTRDSEYLLMDSSEGGDLMESLANYEEMTRLAMDGDEEARKFMQALWERDPSLVGLLAIMATRLEANPWLASHLGFRAVGEGWRLPPLLIPIDGIHVATLCLSRARPAGWLT